MPLSNYGLLTGTIVGHGPQASGNPHYLLLVKAQAITYRVAVNLESTVVGGNSAAELEYQIIPDLRSGPKPAQTLIRSIQGSNNRGQFNLASLSGTPTLDFVRGGIIDMTSFRNIAAGTAPQKNEFANALIQAATAVEGNDRSFVAVFGTGYSEQSRRHGDRFADPRTASLGFSGIDNVHMNQGNYHVVGHHINSHFFENGPNQDGAVLFFLADGTVRGFFTKFASQDNETDANGNPQHTGVSELDAELPQALAAGIRPSVAAFFKNENQGRQRRTRSSAGEAASTPPAVSTRSPVEAKAQPQSPSSVFVFADPSPADGNNPFIPDDDGDTRNSPFVKNFAMYGVPEPVPAPRNNVYPTLDLETVIGSQAIQNITQANSIAFDMVGDTGAPTSTAELANEVSVADLMVSGFTGDTAKDPTFFFHLGDVVYFYGEAQYYYSQFYKPFQQYPRAIFAIPGNHDGITYNEDMVSLEGFIAAFCSDQPGHPDEAGAIARTSMTQPGVYFTLNAPFVSIIGLYSNCSESYGYLDQQQLTFLLAEMKRLKPLREGGQISAVLLAVHHSPLSGSPSKPSSQTMRNDMDNIFQEAQLWPDAVFSGHAHVYQRITRTVDIGGATTLDIPHFISGSGGYAVTKSQEIEKPEMSQLDGSDPQFQIHRFLPNYGYLRVSVTPRSQGTAATLRVEFRSPDPGIGQPADLCIFDLDRHTIVS